MPQFDVFLSHSSLDKPWARQLKADLGRYKLSAWLDEDEIRPGDSIVRALEEALENSIAVALVVSPEALASGWVREEYERAVWLTKKQEQSLQLIPVLLRSAELPGFLQNRNWIDFRDETNYAQSLWRLVWGITGQKPGQVLDLKAPASLSAAIDQPPQPEDQSRPTPESTQTGPAYQAQVTGSGAIAQGDQAKAAGQGGVVADTIHGSVITGNVGQIINYFSSGPSDPASSTERHPQPSQSVPTQPPLDKTALRQAIIARYSLEQVRTLCEDCGVDYEELGHQQKEPLVRELIRAMERRGQLDLLKEKVDRQE